MVSRKVKIISIVSVVVAVCIAVLAVGLYFGLRDKGDNDDDIVIDGSTVANRCDVLKPSDLKGNGEFCSCGKESDSDHSLGNDNCYNNGTPNWCFARVCSQKECDGLCKAVIDFADEFYDN